MLLTPIPFGDPGSNVVECAADVLRLLGHNMPPAGEDLDEAAE